MNDDARLFALDVSTLLLQQSPLFHRYLGAVTRHTSLGRAPSEVTASIFIIVCCILYRCQLFLMLLMLLLSHYIDILMNLIQTVCGIELLVYLKRLEGARLATCVVWAAVGVHRLLLILMLHQFNNITLVVFMHLFVRLNLRRFASRHIVITKDIIKPSCFHRRFLGGLAGVLIFHELHQLLLSGVFFH